MINLIKIAFLLILASNVYALEDELQGLFGVIIGSPLPEQYFDGPGNSYPTRLITLPVPNGYEIDIFNSFDVQFIESSKEVYSIIAEKEIGNGLVCNEEYKNLFSYLDNKYNNLKVTRETNINGNIITSFDGFLSSDGKRKLSLYCSIKEGATSYRLGISIWDSVLSEYGNELWNQVGR